MHIPQIQKTIKPLKMCIKQNWDAGCFAALQVLLVGILLRCDGDKLFGGLGNVISTLDDLLGDQLHVRSRAALWRHRLPALALKPARAGGQQAQRASHRLWTRLLQRKVKGFSQTQKESIHKSLQRGGRVCIQVWNKQTAILFTKMHLGLFYLGK